jgi:uncharacterized membrane protein
MGIGPVEYMVVGFPGNQFKGEIAPALQALVDSNTIRIIDLAFVLKDAEGGVFEIELEDTGSEVSRAFESLGSERGGFVNDDDLRAVGEALEPNSSAALLVWEDVWATRIADAISDAGGVLLDLKRVPRDLVQAAVSWAEGAAES